MIQRILVVENKLGLHARAAAKLVQLTSRFNSEIHVSKEGYQQSIDCKSILGILMLAASRGSRLVLSINGVDEAEACEAIGDLFAAKFGEKS
jgi:phosphocarrier protein HPr